MSKKTKRRHKIALVPVILKIMMGVGKLNLQFLKPATKKEKIIIKPGLY